VFFKHNNYLKWIFMKRLTLYSSLTFTALNLSKNASQFTRPVYVILPGQCASACSNDSRVVIKQYL
jgi:hypothetical protein